MWNLTSYDVNRIKGQLPARRARIDARYAEETKALDADFGDLLEIIGAQTKPRLQLVVLVAGPVTVNGPDRICGPGDVAKFAAPARVEIRSLTL